MYVERTLVKDLPKGAKILSEEEVMEYYNKHIFGTTHTKEVWYLKHGFVISGCSAFLTNFTLTSYYRRRCKVYGWVPTAFTNLLFVAVPSVSALIFHYLECRRRILLQNLCTNCLVGRAIVYQNMFGMLYPLGPSALGCLVIAAIRGTYPVPGILSMEDIKGTFEVWKKFTSRRIPYICALFVLNTAVITFVTYKELDNKDRLDEVLKEQHQKLKALAAEYQKEKK